MTAAVNTGPPMGRDEEAEHRRQTLAAYVEQTEAEIAAIEAKLDGWRQALEDKKAELEALRAEAEGD